MAGGRSGSKGAFQSCWTRLHASGLRLIIAVSLAAVSASVLSNHGQAQTRGEVRIVMPALIEVQTATESPLPIRIGPRTAIPKRAMILVRGLPSTVALSAGRLFESGVWGVPVADVDHLRIASPTNVVGQTNFSVSVVTFAGDVLAEAKSSLLIVSPQQLAKRASERAPLAPDVAIVNATPAQPTTAEGGASSSGVDEQKPLAKGLPTGQALERVMLFMTKGEESMKIGNVISARLFFARAANEGWADGALALAATYDPAELASLSVAGGIRADPGLARKWYQKAAELGSQEAETRLRRLSQR